MVTVRYGRVVWLSGSGVTPTPSISGRITLEAGSGVAGIYVGLVDVSDPENMFEFANTLTDASGVYIFEDPPASDYDIDFISAEYTLDPASIDVDGYNGTDVLVVATSTATPV